MVSRRARALYDFQSENEGEISIREREVLTVFNEGVGDGWFEGTNIRGERGLFPATYVEFLPEENDEGDGGGVRDVAGSHRGGVASAARDGSLAQTSTTTAATAAAWSASNQQQQSHNFKTFYNQQQTPAGTWPQQPADQDQDDWDADWDDNSSTVDSSSTHGQFGANGTATSALGVSSLSRYVKAGGEAFISGDVTGCTVNVGDRVRVDIADRGPAWPDNPFPFTCSIEDPTKQTKFKGMKSFISYRLTPTFTGRAVSRRYKHFDWLYGRLVQKFPVVSVPHLPEKQATGRFVEDFVQKRRRGLILWMNHMTGHPVLAQCDAFQHFLTCTDEKAWKQGKRRAEKDDAVGAKFYLTISAPPTSHLDLQDVEARTDSFRSFSKRMDESVVLLNGTAGEMARKHCIDYKRDFQKMGQVFENLGQSFEQDDQHYSDNLTKAIAHTGNTYVAIGELFAQQPQQDLQPLMDVTCLYQGLLANFPDIIHIQKGAVAKVKESQRAADEGKMDAGQLTEVQTRTNTVSHATLAEFNHFHCTRVKDFGQIMQLYLQQQIAFYQAIAGRLDDSLQKYKNL